VTEYAVVATISLLLLSSSLLVWIIFRYRAKRASMAGVIGSVGYSGAARNPDSLVEPNEEALEQMEKLIDPSPHSDIRK